MEFSTTIEEEDDIGKRSRSFRDEDYNNRRVFLRSYPLYLEQEDEAGEEQRKMEYCKEIVRVSNGRKIKGFKEKVLYVLQWSERKVLHLGKLKHKVSFCLISCNPFGFKSTSTSFLSVKC